MDAKLSPPSARRRRPWAVRPWTLVVLALLLVAGTLIQACTDNDHTTGPTFACNEKPVGRGAGSGNARSLAACPQSGGPVPTTGFANTSAEIRVQVGINPNSITPGTRAGVTAFVTNLNGQPLAGKNVQFSTDVGSLDQTVVPTNAQGQASTTLRVTATDVANATGKTAATVTAFVEGASGQGTVTFGPNPTPAPLTLTPPSVTLTQKQIAGVCSFTAQFTAAGGTPPLIFSSGIPGAVDGSGLYTRTGANAVAQGTTIADTVTVTDSAGQTASATVSLTCTP
jgi:hypothetical protein